MAEQSRSRVDLLELAAFVGRWKVFLFGSVLIVSTIVALISFFLTPRYRSEAVIRAAQGSSSNIGALLTSKLASLGGIYTGLGAGMGEIPGSGLVTLLKSRSLSEDVIARFDLRRVYDLPDAPIEDVIDMLKARTSFEMDVAATNLVIQVDDETPTRAKEIADYYVAEVDRRNRELTSQRAQKEREFVGNRLAEAQAQLAAFEDSMASFQVRTGVLDVEEQVRAAIQATARLEAQRIALQNELDLKQQIFAPDSPEIAFLRMQVASIQRSIQDRLVRQPDEASEAFLPTMEEMPSEGKTFARLMRDIEIQQLLVGYLLQQFEQAKIEELRTTPTIVVLDHPSVWNRKVWPRRGLMVVLAALVTLVFAGAAALVIEFMRRAERDPANPNHIRMEQIRKAWVKEPVKRENL